MNDLEKRITAIEKRNTAVELDKAWETSWTRKITISALTYVVVVIYLLIIHANKPFVSALIPVVGFILSTAVIKSIRQIWQK